MKVWLVFVLPCHLGFRMAGKCYRTYVTDAAGVSHRPNFPLPEIRSEIFIESRSLGRKLSVIMELWNKFRRDPILREQQIKALPIKALLLKPFL